MNVITIKEITKSFNLNSLFSLLNRVKSIELLFYNRLLFLIVKAIRFLLLCNMQILIRFHLFSIYANCVSMHSRIETSKIFEISPECRANYLCRREKG